MEWVSHGARYYNSEWGRFISPDPKREFYNQYSYCWDDPINIIDRDGRGGSGVDAKVPVLTSWGYDDPIAAWDLDIDLALQDELERQAYLAEVEAKEEKQQQLAGQLAIAQGVVEIWDAIVDILSVKNSAEALEEIADERDQLVDDIDGQLGDIVNNGANPDSCFRHLRNSLYRIDMLRNLGPIYGGTEEDDD